MESMKRARGRPRKEQKVSVANFSAGTKECCSVVRRDRRFVGGYVRKEFPEHGAFLGKVMSFAAGLYKVLYEDGDCEEVDYDELCKIFVDKGEYNSDTVSKKNRLDQLIHSGKLVPVTTSTKKKRGPKALTEDHDLGDASSGSEPSSQSVGVARVQDSMSGDGGTNMKHKRQKVIVTKPRPLLEAKSIESEIEQHSKDSKYFEISTPLEKTSIHSRGPSLVDDDGRSAPLYESSELCLDREAESYSASCESDDLMEGRGVLIYSNNILPPPQPLPPSSSDIGVPLEAVGSLFSVYNFIRSFSHQLFLSPFSFEEFVASLHCSCANSIFDAIHVSLLQALKRRLEALSSDGDALASRILRHLDWNFVDTFTWPAFVIEYVLVSGVISKLTPKACINHLVGEYYASPVSTKLKILQILCDDVIASAELRIELDIREKKEMIGDGDPSLPAENRPAIVHSEQLEISAMSSISALNPPLHAPNPSPNSNTVESKTDLLVADVDSPKDGNSDECCLCSMDGMLVCCDGCPSAYHSRCVGINKALLPDGPWFCPECVVNKTGSTSSKIGSGLRGAEMFGLDPYGRAFFGTCNYLLVLEDSSNQEAPCRYYNAYDVPSVLRALYSSEHSSLPIYSDICKRIVKYWGILDKEKSASPNSVMNASLNSHTLGLKGDVNGTQTLSIPAKENVSAPLNSHTLGLKGDANGTHMLLITAKENDPVCHKIETNSFPSDVCQSCNTFGSFPDHQGDSHATGNYGSRTLQKGESLDSQKCDIVACAASEGSESLRMRICETFDNSSLGSDPPSRATKENKNPDLDPAASISVLLGGDASLQGKQHLRGKSASTESVSCVSGSRMQPVGVKGDAVNAHVVSMGASYQKVDFIPHAYTNQYILGEIAASAAANLSIMAAEDKKLSSNSTFSNPKDVASANTTLQKKAFSSVASHFFWPCFEKKPIEIQRERCGWCASCNSYLINSNNRKGCLLNAAASNSLRGIGRSLGDGSCPAKNGNSQIGAIGAYILHVEECLRGLMCGSWQASNQRQQWRKQVEQASTCRELKTLLLLLEENIRLIAFSGAWIKQADDWLSEVSAAEKCVIPVRQSQKLGLGKKNRKSSGTYGSTHNSVESSSSGFVWWRGGKLSKQILNKGLLPSVAVKKAARQSGSRRIVGVLYPENSEIPRRIRRVAWRSAVEMVKSTCHLALQVRYLDAHIRWNDLYRPEQVSQDMKGSQWDYSAFRFAVLCEKIVENNQTNYMLDFGIQKDIPARLMKHVAKTDQGKDGKCKFLFSEHHVPLYLIKEYEEKIPFICARQSMLNQHSRQSITLHRDFPCLIQKVDMPETLACDRCQSHVSPKVAVKCRFCQGSFHKVCVLVTSVIGELSEPAFTCYTCYCSGQDDQRTGCNDDFMNHKVGQMNALKPQNRKEMGPCLNYCASTSLKCGEAQKDVLGTVKPSQKILKKRGDGTEYGLILKKNKSVECSPDFWSKNVLSGRNQCVDGSLTPTCVVCQNPYNPDLLYVKCEYCERWFHGDALNLVEDHVVDVIGFKCCRCRKKCMPSCPYADPDKKKLNKNTRRKRASSVHHIEPHQRETVPSISLYENLLTVDGSEEEGDPFLFSLEKVEAVMEQPMSETGHIRGNTGLLCGGTPQKLPIRRCHVKEKSEYVDDFPLMLEEEKEKATATESSLQSKWQLPGHCQNGEVAPNSKARSAGSETTHQDMQYEPQTYFSFTELLASEDHRVEDMPNMSMSDPINENADSLPDISFDSSFTSADCGICACRDPVPDVSCSKCGFFVHGTCLPFSTKDGWICGSCEN